MNGPKTIGAAAAAAILVGLAIAAWIRSPDADAIASTAAVASQRPGDPMLAARSKGSPGAPIAIFEMSDFQCPFCKQFFDETWRDLETEYVNTGKVRFTFLNLPLIQLHPNAAEAHEFAMCAATQDMFWPAHDRLFETQGTWEQMSDPTAHFRSLAEGIGIDGAVLDRCIQNGAMRNVVAADVQMAYRNGLNSTPTFIIEGGILTGAVPMDVWRPVLDSIYAAKTGNSE